MSRVYHEGDSEKGIAARKEYDTERGTFLWAVLARIHTFTDFG